MDPQTFLQTFKNDLKKQVATNLEKSLEMLFTVLNQQTPTRNELLALEGKFNQVKSENLKSIISYDDKTLAINQIRNGAFEFIQKLEYQDLDPSFSPELKNNIETFKASSQIKATHTTATTKVPAQEETTPITSPIKETEAKIQAISPDSSPTPLSFPEYELFVAQHQSILKTFPKLFRRAREISIRRDMKSATSFHQNIQTNLEALQKFDTLLKPISDNIKQIRLDRNNEIYWLQYKMIKAVPETVEADQLDAVATNLPKLVSLHETLSKLNLI